MSSLASAYFERARLAGKKTFGSLSAAELLQSVFIPALAACIKPNNFAAKEFDFVQVTMSLVTYRYVYIVEAGGLLACLLFVGSL